MNIHIRWLIRRDFSECISIEQESFTYPWGEDGFITCLKQRNCIGMIAEDYDTDEVLGYMIYELHKYRLELLNFAVAAKYRRQGVGRAMVEKLISKLSAERRKHIALDVSESNLGAQLFFKAMGFNCVNILKNYYIDIDDDAYTMTYQLGTRTYQPVNRISKLV